MTDEKTKTEEFHIGVGQDSLCFKHDPYFKEKPRGKEYWAALGYRVRPLGVSTGAFFCASRPSHSVLGEFFKSVSTVEAAMQACAEDWHLVCRLKRWQDYMIAVEPPGPMVFR